jgi:predicted phage terminase large subunit-like protein
MIDWWLDEAGYPILDRSGAIRWFVNIGDVLTWADTRQELINRFVHDEKMDPEAVLPKSFTFIPSKITDNKILLKIDPGYLANLNALPYVERMRMLYGNWKIRPAAGNYFKREWFEVIDPIEVPYSREKARYWDRAATKPSTENPDPSWTVGLKGSKSHTTGITYIENMIRFRNTPGVVQTAIRNAATHDGTDTEVILEQDPGQAGVVELSIYSKLLAGWPFRYVKPTVDKETRAKTASAQAEHGMIKVVRGAWNDAFFNELENFPEGAHDDIVDCISGLVNCFEDVSTLNYEALTKM